MVVANRPEVTLVVGVNGTGKTTTVGKLANLLKQMSVTGVLAVGMLMVIVSGNIDLSKFAELVS